jgi:hypothetical protein
MLELAPPGTANETGAALDISLNPAGSAPSDPKREPALPSAVDADRDRTGLVFSVS